MKGASNALSPLDDVDVEWTNPLTAMTSTAISGFTGSIKPEGLGGYISGQIGINTGSGVDVDVEKLLY